MKRFFLLSVCVFLTHFIAKGQKDSLLYQLQAVEVVATRMSIDSSARQSTLNASEIKKLNYGYDAPFVLSGLPSVVSVSENGSGLGGGSLYIRGTDATRINVTMNGVPMNDPDSHSMYWYDTPDVISATGSVQLLRGAGTSTNGTGAFGGAISFSSSPLSNLFNGDAFFSYGSFNTSKQSVHIGSGLLGNHLLLDLRLTHLGSDGYIDRGFTDMLSYMFQAGWTNSKTLVKLISFGGKSRTYLTYNGVTQEEIDLYGRKYHTSGQYVCSDGPYVLADGTKVNYFDDQTDNYLQINNQLLLVHSFSNKWKLNVVGYYTYGNGYYRQYKDDAYLCGYDNLVSDWRQADLVRRKNMKNHRFGVNANAVFNTNRWNFVFGGSYLNHRAPHYGTLDWIDGEEKSLYQNHIWYDNNVVKHDANIFVKARWTPIKGLDVYADVQGRFVKYNAQGKNDNYNWNTGKMQEISVDKIWIFVNPGVGVKYSFLNHHTVEASFAMTNKEPTRSDFTDRYMFSSLETKPLPETLFDSELSYNYVHPVVKAGVNLYYMYYHNQLVPSGVTNDSGDNLNINVDKSFRRGIELSLGLTPLRWMVFGFSATLSQNKIDDFTEIKDGQSHYIGRTDIANSPSVLLKGSLCFKAAGFEGTIFSRYVGKQYVTNGSHDELSLPEWTTTDIDFGYTLPKKLVGSTIRLGVRVNNVFNAQYSSAAYVASSLYYFPQPGINAIGSVSISF